MIEPIVVKQSLKGNILYAAIALVMCFLCLLLVFINFRETHGIFGLLFKSNVLYFLVKIIMVIGVFFFGYGFYFILKKAKSGNNLLTVDENGITDKTSALAFGFIPWMDIDKIYIDSVMGNEFIELVLNNEEKYINRLNGMKKMAVSANKKMGHQAVCITLNSSGISPQMLLPKIQEIFQQVKKYWYIVIVWALSKTRL